MNPPPKVSEGPQGSETPRTDEVLDRSYEHIQPLMRPVQRYDDMTFHAMKLERELSALREVVREKDERELKLLRDIEALVIQRDALREVVTALQRDLVSANESRQKWRSRMGLTPSSDALLERAEMAEKLVAELREVVREVGPYLEHKDNCVLWDKLTDCQCGLDALRAKMGAT